MTGIISFAQVTIYNANFSNTAGDNAWTTSHTRGSNWLIGQTAYHTGNSSGDYLFTSKSSGRYQRNTLSAVISPTIDLTGYERMTFSIDLDHEIRNAYDGFNIAFSNDNGVTWYTLGKQNDEATNWYNTGQLTGTTAMGFGNWSYDRNWYTASIDLPSQGFDDRSGIRFKVEFYSNDSNTNDVGVAFDNVVITGYPKVTKVYPDCGLGIGQNLELWLNTRTLTGLSDGDPIDMWANISSIGNPTIDTGATSAIASGTDRPIYYDNPTNNVNFNPVVSFDGTKSMFGKSGFYNRDIFIVINPTLTISASRPTEDVFLGDDYTTVAGSQDVTGISINDTSARYGPYPDIAAYNQGSQTAYGRAIIHPTLVYDRPVIFNARLNAAGDGMDLYLDGVDLGLTLDPSLMQEANASTFTDILNSRYWLGRSEYFGSSFTGDIMEIMSFSERKSNADRTRLESYLAVKYGITLGLFPVPALSLPHVPGTYYDSDANPLWNAVTDNGFTYNVAGIGYDDCSLLNQKQAKSVDPFTFITVGLGDIYDTNSANPNSFQDSGDFLMWGSTLSTLTALPNPLEVTLGPSLVTTFTEVTERTWKFKEISQVGNDIPEVKLSVSTAGLSSLPALVGNDAYVMIVADDENFTTGIETVFLKTVGTNQEAYFDFDGTKFVKFGVAHEVIASKDIDFDGTNDYVAINDEIEFAGDYSVSAWINIEGNNSTNTNRTIVSNRGGANDGFQFYIDATNNVVMQHNNTDALISNTSLSNDVWRYVTFTYDASSGEGAMYIDGVLDRTSTMPNPILNDESFCIGSRFVDKTNITDNFRGHLDEIRLFNTVLTVPQIRFMMNQELNKVGVSGIAGAVIPQSVTKNDISALDWTNLEAYFNMNTYIGTHLNDASGNGHRGSLIQPDNFNIQEQTAPLPYVSQADGDWNTAGAWKDGTQMFVPGSVRNINGTNYDIDWNIAVIEDEVIVDDKNHTLLGLEVVNGALLNVGGDIGITVTHSLHLDGTIDLKGESQLVQNEDSDLISSTTGNIEVDQQGTSDLYNYNYWSSPVSIVSNSTNNNGFSVREVLKDGTDVDNVRDLNFTAYGVYNGAPGNASNAATVSSRWIYTYGNLLSGSYANWEYSGPDGFHSPAEGWTMKGTGASTTEQNYTFVGKPNNGDISLPIDDGNDYLTGNPYPSALDIHQFISDNPDLDGTLYFWEHWGGNSHVYREYQGGYATYNLSGGLGNATIGTSHPDVNQGGIATKVPGRYVPVGQGFFVVGIYDGGSINFNNSQRIFEKESGGQSLFVRAPGSTGQVSAYDLINTPQDPRRKIRLGFDSPSVIHRQLLVTEDIAATTGVDRGYDALLLDENRDDMSWDISGEKYAIQGIDQIDAYTELPLIIKMGSNGSFDIKLDGLSNVDNTQKIFLKDAVLNTYTDLMQGTYTSPQLTPGRYQGRFSIVFDNPSTLGTGDELIDENSLIVFTPADTDEIRIRTTNEVRIEQVSLYNMLGQLVQSWDVTEQAGTIIVDAYGVASGNYIVIMQAGSDTYTRKIIMD